MYFVGLHRLLSLQWKWFFRRSKRKSGESSFMKSQTWRQKSSRILSFISISLITICTGNTHNYLNFPFLWKMMISFVHLKLTLHKNIQAWLNEQVYVRRAKTRNGLRSKQKKVPDSISGNDYIIKSHGVFFGKVSNNKSHYLH